jgi:hypothetical protein
MRSKNADIMPEKLKTGLRFRAGLNFGPAKNRIKTYNGYKSVKSETGNEDDTYNTFQNVILILEMIYR